MQVTQAVNQDLDLDDPVSRAIKNCDKHLMIGRINSLDDLFESISYSNGRSLLPWPENKTFSFLSEVGGTVNWVPGTEWHLSCKPKDEFMQVVIQHIGRCRLRESSLVYRHDPRYTGHEDPNFSALSSFRLNPWPAAGVALLLASRADCSSYATWVGFIDLKNVPSFRPPADLYPKKRAARPGL